MRKVFTTKLKGCKIYNATSSFTLPGNDYYLSLHVICGSQEAVGIKVHVYLPYRGEISFTYHIEGQFEIAICLYLYISLELLNST